MKRFPSAFLLLLLAFTLGCSNGSSSKPSSDSKSGGNAGTGGGQSGSGGNADSGGGKSKPDAPNTVEVPLDQQQIVGIRTAQVQPRSVPRTLVVPAQIMMDEQRTAHIAPYSDGRVTDILHYVGDLVHRGQVLAHLHSHSVHETVGALAQNFANLARAQSALTYAQQKHDRYQHLYSIQAASLEQQQGSQQELVQAQTDLSNAQAAVTMEREHLADILEIAPESISPATLYTYENVPIITPLSGIVITRTVTPGMVLEPGNEAYTVSDLSQVWMIASVSEADLPHLHTGQRVTVRSNAWGDQTFPGTVTLIGSSLDPSTRTIQVRASLANPRNQLKPLMFVTATINESTTEAGTRQAIFVPEDALQEINGVQSIFTTTDGTHFTPRALKTAPPIGGAVEVIDGLRPGDHIAIAGAFMLKSDLLKGTLGDE